jgi:DNA-binding PadR family transcriptional regulator
VECNRGAHAPPLAWVWVVPGSQPLSIKHAILGLLARGPLHGYELKAAYEAELAPSTQLNYGQVYTTLERLGRDGLLAHEVVSQSERPDKKVYALTRAGRKELKEWLATPSRLDLDLRNETFLKIMLARRLDDADPLEVLNVERRACFERLHEVTQARARADRDGESVPTALLLDLAVLRLEAFLKWLDHCEEVLKKENKR